MSKQHYIIPIFVSHRGCPHDCIFCNQKKITGSGGDAGREDVINKIEEYLQTIPTENSTIEVAFYGGSFTAIPLEQQKELLSAVQPYIERNLISNIRVSTRPDCISEAVITVLKDYHVKIVELGVQSMDEEVLRISNRGHSAQDVIEAVATLKQHGFTVGVQVMVGLPGDTEQKSIDTVKKLINLKPDIARIYPALVIRNTYMEEMFRDGSFIPFTLDKTVEVCKKLLVLFERNDIEVIRIGLQPTENILEGKEVVAGPFHPSMRQLVVSAIYRDMMDYMLKGFHFSKDLYVYVNPKDISDVIGQKKVNVDYIIKQHNIGRVHILQDNEIEIQSILMKIAENSRKLSIKDFRNILEI